MFLLNLISASYYKNLLLLYAKSMHLIPEYFMPDMILILSRCQAKKSGPKTLKVFFRFHFKGFYNGSKIKEIHVYPHQNEDLAKGQEYLLWVSLRSVRESVLEVSLLKYKKIE
jgi:hypothetical protein